MGNEVSELNRLKCLAHIVRKAYEKSWNSDNLGGACFDATRQLFCLARDYGITVQIGLGDGHAFVLLGDTIVDVTATQFGKYRKVLVSKLGRLAKRVYFCQYPWKLESRHNSIWSANKAWGDHCGREYRRDRKIVLETLKKERQRCGSTSHY